MLWRRRLPTGSCIRMGGIQGHEDTTTFPCSMLDGVCVRACTCVSVQPGCFTHWSSWLSQPRPTGIIVKKELQRRHRGVPRVTQCVCVYSAHKGDTHRSTNNQFTWSIGAKAAFRLHANLIPIRCLLQSDS